MAFAMLNKPPLRVLIAAPRGFCAGVDRAIQIVELALERFGAPVYVRHEIVHNRFVVERLRDLGAIFVDELDEVPDDRPVVFSAHGVPKSVPAAAQERRLTYVDATCPLVSKVHRQAERLIEEGRHILFIGHAGHPEVIGTFGQVPAAFEHIDPAQQVREHVWVSPYYEDNLPLLRDEQVDSYVKRLGEQLVDNIPAELRQPAFRYSFQVVNLKEINAFALPGGPMFLNRGMLDAAKTDGEVIGVMAHEISHVVLRHGTAQATKGQKFQAGAIAR